MAQNMTTYEICGYTEQDGFDEVLDIPSGFEQRVLPGHYGRFLTLAEISNFTLIENGMMKNTLDGLSVFFLNSLGLSFSDDKISKSIDMLAAAVALISPMDGESWDKNIYYSTDTIVEKSKQLYIAKISNISNINTAPDIDTDLWIKTATPYSEWSIPAGEWDAYRLGDKVKYGDIIWQSAIDLNLNMPGIVDDESWMDIGEIT
jgi:hypothetical protein